jgi:hypothetical protein
MHCLAKRSRFAVLLFACLAVTAWAQEDLASARVVPTSALPEPAYLQTVTDPAFGTPFTRVTDPGEGETKDLPCRPTYCTHRYSSAQAWNADQSLLVIMNGCGGACFLDGQTYRPLFARASPNECEWHPANAALMICMAGNTIYRWYPRTDRKATIFAAAHYRHLQFGPYKGNLSRDGSKLVVRALDRHGALVAFAYDIVRRRKYPDIRLGRLAGRNGYCSISPSARYIFCDQDMPDETNQAYVFTIGGVQLQHWTEDHRPGHGDMTIDRDGSDVYVGVSKSDPDRYHVVKRRLQDGTVTDLAQYGEGQHVSLRNTKLPGWAFVTYTGTHDEVAAHPEWEPFYQEVVALRIDGRGEIRRIVQTRRVGQDYWSEAHASPSPDGTQVIWSSNWGTLGAPVADYVARISWPAPRTVAMHATTGSH